MVEEPGRTSARRDPALPDLSGRTAVVTGASGGIGAGIAHRLADAGANVVIGYRSDRAGAERLAAEISAQYDDTRALDHAVETTDPASCRAMVARAVAAFGAVDILVNNAGVQPVQDLAEISAADWQGVIDANVTGTFLATAAAAEQMADRGGSIIHIASIEGLAPAFGHGHYAASKAAVIMHAKSAALEWGPRGIRVNCVSPGLIDREGLAESWPDGVSRYTAAAPLGRIGTAAEIGDACVFLASDLARWITGANLVVDGGVSVHPTW